MKTITVSTIVLSVIFAASGLPEAFAKGGEDNPVVAILDESGNTVKIDPDHNDVDVGTLPAVKIDPSQNDVNVGSLPAVKIDASQNDVNANITNEVEIKNDSGAAILVDTGAMARTPFAVRLSTGPDQAGFQAMILKFDVPTDSILVIESISASLRVTGGNGPEFAEVGLYTGGVSHDVHLPIHPQPGIFSNGLPMYVVNQPLRLYADGDSIVTFLAFAEIDESIMGTVSFSGYLVPVGDPSLAP